MKHFLPKEFVTELSKKISEHPLSLIILLFLTATSFVKDFKTAERIEIIHQDYQAKLEQCNQRYIERLEHQTKVIERNTLINEKLLQKLDKI